MALYRDYVSEIIDNRLGLTIPGYLTSKPGCSSVAFLHTVRILLPCPRMPMKLLNHVIGTSFSAIGFPLFLQVVYLIFIYPPSVSPTLKILWIFWVSLQWDLCLLSSDLEYSHWLSLLAHGIKSLLWPTIIYALWDVQILKMKNMSYSLVLFMLSSAHVGSSLFASSST